MASIRYSEGEIAAYLSKFYGRKAKAEAGTSLCANDLESSIVAAVAAPDSAQDVRA
jgi:hypothetical protein